MLDNIDRMMIKNNRNPVFILNNNGEFIDINDVFCQKVGSFHINFRYVMPLPLLSAWV